MNKSELIEALSKKEGLTEKKAIEVINLLFKGFTEELQNGGRIEIRGFGSFSVNYRPPRMGRNPRSGESVAIPEKQVPHFKPGKALRQAVDQRTHEILPSA